MHTYRRRTQGKARRRKASGSFVFRALIYASPLPPVIPRRTFIPGRRIKLCRKTTTPRRLQAASPFRGRAYSPAKNYPANTLKHRYRQAKRRTVQSTALPMRHRLAPSALLGAGAPEPMPSGTGAIQLAAPGSASPSP